MIFMKDRYSHCMNKVRSILILCLMLGCQALSHAQRYEDVVKRNWKPKDAVITEDVNPEVIVETREQEEEISIDENGDH